MKARHEDTAMGRHETRQEDTNRNTWNDPKATAMMRGVTTQQEMRRRCDIPTATTVAPLFQLMVKLRLSFLTTAHVRGLLLKETGPCYFFYFQADDEVS